MARARIAKELHCEAPDEIGLLGRVVVALAQEKVFIQHLSAYSANQAGYLQLVTTEEDIDKAKKAISYFINKVEVRDVLIVEFENKVGTLAEVAKTLGNNSIRIDYVYGTSADGFKIVGIISTDNNAKACELINGDK